MSDPIWPVPVELIDEVLHTWQNAEAADDTTDAEALLDAFAHHGLQVLPIAPDDDLYVVEVDGEPVSRPHMRSPHSANEAAGLWLAAISEKKRRVLLRKANPAEVAAEEFRSREALRRDLQP